MNCLMCGEYILTNSKTRKLCFYCKNEANRKKRKIRAEIYKLATRKMKSLSYENIDEYYNKLILGKMDLEIVEK